MPISGWRTRSRENGAACAKCGDRLEQLYQGRRYAAGGWEDIPDVLLCGVCREARLHAQHAEEDAALPQPWWLFWRRH